MKFKDFRLWERGVSNDWAIKIDKIKGKRWMYCLDVVLEGDVTDIDIPYGDDAVENMYLEMYYAMYSNAMVIEFLEKWGSILKCSDTTKQVLDSYANSNGRKQELTRDELDIELEIYEIWEPRYMWRDQVRDMDWVGDILEENGIIENKEIKE